MKMTFGKLCDYGYLSNIPDDTEIRIYYGEPTTPRDWFYKISSIFRLNIDKKLHEYIIEEIRLHVEKEILIIRLRPQEKENE